jgi:hypothetical protein
MIRLPLPLPYQRAHHEEIGDREQLDGKPMAEYIGLAMPCKNVYRQNLMRTEKGENSHENSNARSGKTTAAQRSRCGEAPWHLARTLLFDSQQRCIGSVAYPPRTANSLEPPGA